jgi:hypothetical protein
VPYVHKVYTGKCRTYTCRTYTIFTLESAVHTQGLHWKVPYVHKVYTGKCRTYTGFTLESAVGTQVLHWKVSYVHKVYTVKCRPYTRFTLESAVRTQFLHWKMPYVHNFYTGKCHTYTRFTLESAVRKQILTVESAVRTQGLHWNLPYVQKVTANLLYMIDAVVLCWTFHKLPSIHKLMFFEGMNYVLAYLLRTLSLLPRSAYLKEVCWLHMFLMMGIRPDALNMYGRSFYYLAVWILLYGGWFENCRYWTWDNFSWFCGLHLHLHADVDPKSAWLCHWLWWQRTFI